MNPMATDPVEIQAHKRIGTVLRSKWRLDRLIGVGGMAAVYAATHRNGNRVAVKILHTHLSADADVRDRFLREGYVANAVDHPGAVRVLDDDAADDGSAFLVMELLEGQTLDATWESNGCRLDVAHVLWVTDGLLDVLAAAHDHGIVHRDVKPENVFLTTDGAVKVLDFGIARLRELSGGPMATRAGSMLGTPAFMPPEQALGRSSEVDGRSDIWAVGATAFMLLSGQLVHEGNTANEQLVAAATRHARSLASVAPELPVQVVAIVDRALAYDKSCRWPDARSMQHAITAYTASVTGKSQAIPLQPPALPAATIAGAPANWEATPSEVKRTEVAAGTGAGARAESSKSARMTTGRSSAAAYSPASDDRPNRHRGLFVAAATILGVIAVLTVVAVTVFGRRAPNENSGVPLVQPTPQPAPDEQISTATAARSAADIEPVPPDATTDVGAVFVTASGGACNVHLAGKWIGITPVRRTNLPIGELAIVCAPPNGSPLLQAVRVRAGETTRVFFVVPPPRKKDPLDKWK